MRTTLVDFKQLFKQRFNNTGTKSIPKLPLLLIALILQLTNGFGQTVSISGTVLDEEQIGIPGVNIAIKGTTVGAITAPDGSFTLNNVDANDTLTASFIGYLTNEVAVNGQQNLTINLTPDFIDLGEVVVVGYGSMRKSDLTGSVSSMQEDDLIKTAVPNITSTLAGKMTGVITRQTSGRPGADSPSFLIRGKSTFDPDGKGTNNPLVLVDGIQRDFSRIDPNDIESVTILKDAASAAIYGSRGANGVILVTTKRGTNTTPEVTFSTSYTAQKPTFRPEYMNAGQYAQYLNEASINKGQNAPFTDEQVLQYQDGTLPSTDWWNEMMRNSAPISQVNLAVNGKANNTSYYLSLGHIDQKGLYESSNYKRYNIRSNIDTKISDNLSAFVNIALRKDLTNSSVIDDYKIHHSLETAIPTIAAFVPEELRTEGDDLGLNFNGTAGSPIGEALYSGYNNTGGMFAESTIGMKYDLPFVKGLSFKFDFSYDYSNHKQKKFKDSYLLNYYTIEEGLTQTIESESLLTLYEQNEQRTRQTIQTGLNYNRSFGLHSLSGVLIFEQMDYRYEHLSAYREDFLAPTIDQLFAGSDVNKDNNGYAAENARQAYVGRVMYNYADKYLLQVNGRYDGSYNFPEDKRWGFFPAVSAGWRISKESFMSSVDFINNLKLRASWGQFGNDNVDPFYYLAGYEFSNGLIVGDTYMTGIMDTGIPNTNITWETATNMNYGFEVAVLDGRLTAEFDYFTKRTEGILITRNASVPETFGSELPKENLGIVDNYGYEAILGYRERLGDFSYGIEGNVTYATSEVIYIDEPAEVEDRLKQTGRAFDSRYGYTALGLFQTIEEIQNAPIQDANGNASILPGDIKYLDLNGDNIIDDNDRHYIGKGATPELIFGLNGNLGYKNLDLSFSFQGASNYTRYQYLSSFEKNYNTYSVLEDSWREGNEDAQYPRLEANGRSANNSFSSTYWMHEGFYVKLRNIELSYSLYDKSYLEKIGIKQMSISASARNILTIAKKDGFDPEGTDNRYPIMQTMSLGLNVTF